MKRYLPVLTAVLLLNSGSDPAPLSLNTTIQGMKVDKMVEPRGIDTDRPLFSWYISTTAYNITQESVRIVLSTDSNHVKSESQLWWKSAEELQNTPQLRYGGPPLERDQTYYWKVKLSLGSGEVIESGISHFDTGLRGSSISGQWLSDGKDIEYRPAPIFRKTFEIESNIVKAKIYIASQGIHEININGKRVSYEYLNPIPTEFTKKLFYNAYEITEYVRLGKNVITVILGNGFFNHQPIAAWDFYKAPWRERPAFAADMIFKYKNGGRIKVSTDETWKTTDSPFKFNSIYLGDSYDKRMENKAWYMADFDDKGWKQPTLKEQPRTNIVRQNTEAVQVTDTLLPVKISKRTDRNYTIYFDRNIAGKCQLSVNGKSGQKVYIRYGEQLREQGRVDNRNLTHHYLKPKEDELFQTDILILNGNNPNTFSTLFGYKGFQFVELHSSEPFTIMEDEVQAYVLSSHKPTAEFETGITLVNDIWEAANNSIQANLMGYPTGCPTREKLGWTGDVHVVAPAAAFNFDVENIFTKWIEDHRDAQRPDGNLPHIIPTSGWGYESTFDWTLSAIEIPWNLYLFYGNKAVLGEYYEMMQSFISFWMQRSSDNLLGIGLGDWSPPSTLSDITFTTSVLYFQTLKTFSKISHVLGKNRERRKFHELSNRVKAKINSRFLKEDRGIYANGTQTEQSLAIYYDIVPDAHKEKVYQKLSEIVKSNGNRIDVGILGTKALFTSLCIAGFCGQALEIATQTDQPSFGNWLKSGSKTLYEGWDFSPGQYFGGSRNHMYFGSISEWFFKYIGGIRPLERRPGFEMFELSPYFFGKLKTASVKFKSVVGTIESSWKFVEERGGGSIL